MNGSGRRDVSRIYAYDKPWFGRLLSIERLGLGNGRDRDSHAGDSNGEFRTLPCRRV
jgi:hypothetical protein